MIYTNNTNTGAYFIYKKNDEIYQILILLMKKQRNGISSNFLEIQVLIKKLKDSIDLVNFLYDYFALLVFY